MQTYETLKQIAKQLAELQKTASSEREWSALSGIQEAMSKVDSAIENTKQGQQESISFILGK